MLDLIFFPMDFAIDFNRQLVLYAEEIKDIPSKRVLPPEFHPVQPAISQGFPEYILSLGRLASLISGSHHDFWISLPASFSNHFSCSKLLSDGDFSPEIGSDASFFSPHS
jgi:hypothetical protein